MGSKATMPTDKFDEETMLQDTTPSKEENKEEDVPNQVSATNKRVVDEKVVDEVSSKEKKKKSCAKIKTYKYAKKFRNNVGKND